MSQRPMYMSVDEASERGSLDSSGSFDLNTEDPESQTLWFSESNFVEPHVSTFSKVQSSLSRLLPDVSKWIRNRKARRRAKWKARYQRLHRLRRWCLSPLVLFAAFLLVVTLVTIANPSYSKPPRHYQELRQLVQASSESGRANPGGEKVFIAATIFDRDGGLAGGAWGKSVLQLVDLLGPSNAFLSIYENDAGPVAKAALKEMEAKAACKRSMVFEDHLSVNSLPTVQLPDGSKRVKRIAYLAEVRNRALRPLATSETTFDKLLYLNDVAFDPVEAAQLLFSTNAGSGKADYRAACALDFINPFKFYDTFASRDLEGFSMGLPIYPWFSSAGKADSRKDVFDQKDAVRVRSCWGGMVAFDARFFQAAPTDLDDLDIAESIGGDDFDGVRFRAERDVFWDASECCLIHADIQRPEGKDRGIYMNPYIRVAYDARTLSWLGLGRRIEKLFSPFQWVIDSIVGLPWYNPRREEQPFQEVREQVCWSPNASLSGGGAFKNVDRIADHAGFCGLRALQLLREDPKPGEKNWELFPVPAS